ncbi:YopX family protein [Streptococcus pneumoniae]|nr:YopX family protein [Streptococcus pneumoniae]MDG7760863.1 YopX family protein [Streptococcus pneumoniae]MDG7956934.1 YopX family protein [Streptococcus pneumoniae]MDG8363120.1 YopX family protein [Streptococcus pneumoniae]MDG8410421.1 YopX family protein [Streptococcus pneumoniae]MDG8457715.1 YopX family protein [Streptococcus pneumoniae]
MYQPDEVMVGNGDIWIIDEDSVAGEWIVNNDLNLMQSTGIRDITNQEIFEGDVVKTTRFVGRADEVGGFYEYDKEFIGIVKQLEGSWVIDTGSDAVCLWTEIEENEIIGNIYENPELLEEKE